MKIFFNILLLYVKTNVLSFFTKDGIFKQRYRLGRNCQQDFLISLLRVKGLRLSCLRQIRLRRKLRKGWICRWSVPPLAGLVKKSQQ
ncbi:MAG: hypothetical protein AMJ89_03655 [candidate division Zixibacteria bacterium SM23_73]|nr:MAG: hypothetical protein AMJ89_03655 [candidate division Zixibacteria bacterium SM23_73]